MEETQKKELYNEHSIGLYDVQNARDLGGYKTIDGRTVKTGLLIRSGRLSNASKEDIHILKDLYHLNAVVDFRIIRERIDSPDVKIDGVTYYTLPLVDDKSPMVGGVHKRSANNQNPLSYFIEVIKQGHGKSDMYVKLFKSERFQKGMTSFFQILLNNDGEHSILWHCAAGKDRAGSAAALTLLALGVDKETVLTDFDLSNIAYNEWIQKRLTQVSRITRDPEILTVVRSLSGVNADYMQNAIDATILDYGSIENYLEVCMNVTKEDIVKLKDMYLE